MFNLPLRKIIAFGALGFFLSINGINCVNSFQKTKILSEQVKKEKSGWVHIRGFYGENGFYTQFFDLRQKTKEKSRPLLIYLGSEACHYCGVVKREILPTPKLDNFLREKFYLFEVELDFMNRKFEDSALFYAFQNSKFDTIPKILVVDPHEKNFSYYYQFPFPKSIYTLDEFSSPEKLQSNLEKVLERFNK